MRVARHQRVKNKSIKEGDETCLKTEKKADEITDSIVSFNSNTMTDEGLFMFSSAEV